MGKVANKVIDALSKTQAGRSGNNQMEGFQPLGDTFRGTEKGATSTKRLKTTTYVPSFSTANYNLATIKQVVNQNAGKNNQYADLLSEPKPNTGTQYIKIYQATLNKVLQDFKAVESLGITYQPGVRQPHCSVLKNQIKDKSKTDSGGAPSGFGLLQHCFNRPFANWV